MASSPILPRIRKVWGRSKKHLAAGAAAAAVAGGIALPVTHVQRPRAERELAPAYVRGHEQLLNTHVTLQVFRKATEQPVDGRLLDHVIDEAAQARAFIRERAEKSKTATRTPSGERIVNETDRDYGWESLSRIPVEQLEQLFRETYRNRVYPKTFAREQAELVLAFAEPRRFAQLLENFRNVLTPDEWGYVNNRVQKDHERRTAYLRARMQRLHDDLTEFEKSGRKENIPRVKQLEKDALYIAMRRAGVWGIVGFLSTASIIEGIFWCRKLWARRKRKKR